MLYNRENLDYRGKLTCPKYTNWLVTRPRLEPTYSWHSQFLFNHRRSENVKLLDSAAHLGFEGVLLQVSILKLAFSLKILDTTTFTFGRPLGVTENPLHQMVQPLILNSTTHTKNQNFQLEVTLKKKIRIFVVFSRL